MESTSESQSRHPLLLALCVHWDDCSVALGTREGLATEVWSQQPERAAAGIRASDGVATGSHTGPLASRDSLLLVDRLLLRTDTPLSAIDQLCFAQGPGAFTSLRVAAGLVQGLSIAMARPVAGICSLAAMVAQEPGWQRVGPEVEEAELERIKADAFPRLMWLQLSAIDARMGETYFCLHECRSGHYPQALVAPSVGKPADAIALFSQVLAQRAMHDSPTAIILAGGAFLQFPDLEAWAEAAGFDARSAAERSPTAAGVLAVAASIGAPRPGPPEAALPVYVRDKIALDVAEQRAKAAGRVVAAGSGANGK